MNTRTLRRFLFTAHTWLGLHIALFFGLMFVTGTFLVFADEIEAVFVPELWAAQPEDADRASFGKIYDTLEKEFPDGTIGVIAKHPRPGMADRSYINLGGGKRIVAWTDPRSAEYRVTTTTRNLKSILREFHDSLMIPKRIGFLLVTSTSFILLTSVVSGLIVYRRFWKGFFRLPKRNEDSRSYWASVHRLMALWSAPFLLIMALTTFFFFLTGLGFNGVVPKPQPAPAREDVRPANFNGALIDRAEQIVLAEYPEFDANIMAAPGNPTDGIRFSGNMGFSSITGGFTVSVDPVSMEILGIVRPGDRRGNARIGPVANALHYGNWGGQTTRILWSIFGVLTTVMAFGGVRIYLVRTIGEGNSWKGYWRGLGIFGWAYLAMAIGVLAISIIRFAL